MHGANGQLWPAPWHHRYKAHFRLPHMDLVSSASVSEETDACPSVASCFLQVLQTLSKAEQHRVGGSKRNVLQVRGDRGCSCSSSVR